jgi:hypothetical protein
MVPGLPSTYDDLSLLCGSTRLLTASMIYVFGGVNEFKARDLQALSDAYAAFVSLEGQAMYR